MKKIFLTLISLFSLFLASQAQSNDQTFSLPVVYVHQDISTVFNSSEKIVFADMSTSLIVGDQPTPNVLRVKPTEESKGHIGVVTLCHETFIAQYSLFYTYNPEDAHTMVSVAQEQHTNNGGAKHKMSKEDMYKRCKMLLSRDPSPGKTSKAKNHKTQIDINGIYTEGNYFFVDMTVLNHSNVNYTIAQSRFHIKDKKQTKSTNSQLVEITPVMKSKNDQNTVFKKAFRNIYVFEKFTYPDNKEFVLEISELYYTGRQIELRIPYRDIIEADTI